jgi:tetratricopeptide (TPR) repeat protein
MDLPSCPSCGQSVLDEDAEDCPFCGASMSGKRGAKQSPQAGSSGAAADKPADSKKRKSATPDAVKPSSDDPFDVTSPGTRKAVQLLPKPSKGKLHRIVCPMCETAGFQSKKAAGREVRCPNKECLVPIFTAPAEEGAEKSEATVAAEAEALAAESQPKKLSVGVYIGIAAAAAAVLGGGAFYFTSEPAEKELTALEQLQLKGGGNAAGAPVTPANPDISKPDIPVEPVAAPTPKTPPVAEMRNTALQIMDNTSLQRDRNQRKPFCRRLTAEAYAIAGNFDAVTQQLTQLDKVGSQLKYYRILPLVQVAWKHLEAGNTDGATEAVKEAFPLVNDLPTFGTLATDTVTELSTLLVAMNRTPEAVALLAKRTDAGPSGQFLESRLRAEVTGRMPFDLAVALRPVTGWSAPQWVAVTVSLTARGKADQALAFARQAPDQSAVEDCLSGWAEASLIVAGDDSPLNKIDSEIQSLDKTAQSKIQSRCALTLHALGKSTLAAAPLAKARQLVGEPGEAFTIDLQSLKTNPRLQLPDALPIRRKALAASELAHAESLMGETDSAWKTVLLAMDFTRTMAPALTIADQPFVEIKQRGEAAVTGELKTLNNLLTDDEARISYQNYRNRSRQLSSAAAERFTLQEQILTEVLDWGFTDQIWTEVQSRSAATTAASAREPWFATNLAKALYNSFRVNGHSDQAAAVETAVTKKRLDTLNSPRVVALAQAAEKTMSSKPEGGAVVLANFLTQYNEEADKRWQQETMLRLVSRLIAADRHVDAFKLIAAIDDVQTRELAYELAGQETTARGHLVAVFDYARNTDIIPPEKIALLRGFIGQLPAR